MLRKWDDSALVRWLQHWRRGWELGLRDRCRILRQCHPGALEDQLPHVLVCHRGGVYFISVPKPSYSLGKAILWRWLQLKMKHWQLKHWLMHSSSSSFSCSQLPRLINSNFPADPEKMSISGHSMGGHGALICALKNPGKYKACFILHAINRHLIIWRSDTLYDFFFVLFCAFACFSQCQRLRPSVTPYNVHGDRKLFLAILDLTSPPGR